MTGNPKLSASEKTLAVLAAAVADGRLSHISSITGQPAATVHRILSDMVKTGWLVQGEDRIYLPGREAFALAANLRDASQLVAVAEPILRELSAKTGLMAHLGVRRYDLVEYVAKVEAPKPYRMNSRVGGMAPIYSTGIGKVILARMPGVEVTALLGDSLAPVTPHTLTRRQLLAQLPQINARGWAVDDEENELGLRCVGAAVEGPFQAGLSVTGLKYEVDEDNYDWLAAQVKDAAARISNVLGAK